MQTAETSLVPAGRTEGPLNQIVRLVLDSVTSANTKTAYRIALNDFMAWVASRGLPFTKATVNSWKADLESRGFSPSTINARLSPVRKLAVEAADNGFMPQETAAAIGRVRGAKRQGSRLGRWLSRDQARELLEAPEPRTLRGLRDRALLAVAVGCGLRRGELVSLTFEHVRAVEGRFVVADLVGKGGRVRTVPMPAFAKAAVDRWAEAASLSTGRIFRSLKATRDGGRIEGEAVTAQTVFRVVTEAAGKAGVEVAVHDLRRTHAKLAHKAGCPIEEIKAGLGHSSITTTEVYLGLRQNLQKGPGDYIDLGLGT